MKESNFGEHVESIFLRAVELPEKERSHFLDRTCSGNSVLRARVEELLGTDSRLGDFLEEPALEFGKANEPSEELESNRVIGPYRLVKLLGRGGFGDVYLAQQQSPIVRQVAVKVIQRGMDSAQVIARFEAERQALARMDHPNIARVLDAGSTSEGRPYFVMDLVEGVPITRFCDEHEWPVHQRLRLFLDVCSGVQHAHQKGIIHRDLKPGNILVTMNHEEAMVKIIDFGIAKAAGQERIEQAHITGVHQFVGTPAYMSPEQARLHAKDVDTRSDIYSLGVLLYELLTGHTPFDMKSLMEEGQETVFRHLREVEPPWPSTRVSTMKCEERTAAALARREAPDRMKKLLRRDLDWVVMKALEKDRQRRYETASALAQDVRRYLESEPVTAAAPNPFYTLRKFVRRNSAAAVAGAVVLVSLIAALGAALWSYRNEHAARAIADDARITAELARAAERKLLYAANMKEVQSAIGQGNSERAETLLNAHLPTEEAVDLRGWMWRYLDGQLSQGMNATHFVSVASVGVSPKGRHLVATGYQAKNHYPVLILDASTLQVQQALEPASSWTPGIWYAPWDPTSLIVETVKGINRYNLHHEEVIRTEPGDIFPLKLTPDGKYFVGLAKVPGMDRTNVVLRAWPVEEASAVRVSRRSHRLPDYDRLHLEFRVSPDGEQVAMSGSGKRVLLFSLPDLEEGRTINVQGDVSTVAWSPDSSILATGYNYPYVIDLWEVATGNHLATLAGSQISSCYDLCFSPNGSLIAFTEKSSLIHIWDTDKSMERHVYLGSSAHSKLTFFPDGTKIATAGTNGRLTIWDTSPDRMSELDHLTREHGSRDLAYSPDGSRLAVKSADNIVRIFDTTTHQQLQTLEQRAPARQEVPGARRAPLRFSPDGRLLAVGNNEESVTVFDCSEQNPPVTLRHMGGTVRDLSFSPDGPTIATAGPDESVIFWNASNGKESFRLTEDYHLDAVAFSPASNSGLVAYGNRQVLSLASLNKAFDTKSVPVDGLQSLSFSPDGTILACSLEDQVALYEIPSLELRETVRGARGAIPNVSFTSDGSTLAIPCSVGFVQLWNRRIGAEVGRLLETGDLVLSAKFSPDNHTLAVLTMGHGIRFFHAPATNARESLERRHNSR